MFTFFTIHYTTEVPHDTMAKAAKAYCDDTTSPFKKIFSRFTYSDGSHTDHVLMKWEMSGRF